MSASTVDVVVVLDVSGSLGTGEVSAASTTVIETLLDAAPEGTAWAVVAVGGAARRAVGWTGDDDAVRDAVQQLSLGGASPLHDGVMVAADLLQLRPPGGRQIMLVIADGDDSGGRASLDEAVRAVDGVEVWALELPTRDTDRDRLERLVGDAGGAVVPLSDAAAVEAMVRRLTEPAVQATTTVPVVSAPTTVVTPQAAPATSVPETPAPATTAPGDPVSLLLMGAGAMFAGLSLALTVLWPRHGTQPGLQRMADRLSAGAERLLLLAGRRRRLSAVLDAAGVAVRPGELVMGALTFAVSAGVVVGALTRSPVLGLLAAVAVVIGVAATLDVRLQRRRRAFAEQLPDLLGSLASALRAGYALSQALDAVARSSPAPGGDELARVVTEIRLGRSAAEALAGVATRTASRDFAWAVTAMEIHREVGGDLGVIFETVAETARERLRLQREVHALTAEGRVSAAVLTALPPLLVLTLVAVSPDYLAPLSDGVGPFLLTVAGALMVVGWWWMRRLVRSGVQA